jgi:hypothetical protein
MREILPDIHRLCCEGDHNPVAVSDCKGGGVVTNEATTAIGAFDDKFDPDEVGQRCSNSVFDEPN